MTTNNENKEYESNQSKSDSQNKPENPMKSVQTRPLPTKMVYFNDHSKKKEAVTYVPGQKIVKTKKPRVCFGCGREFSAGTMMARRFVIDGTLYKCFLCSSCQKAEKELDWDDEYGFRELRERALEIEKEVTSMAEYIDRETALKAIREVYEYEFPTASGAFDEFATKVVPSVLKSIPAADVAPVVYCRECKYHHWEQEPCHGRTEHYCSLIHGLTTVYRDTFCSYGKRREMDGGGANA